MEGVDPLDLLTADAWEYILNLLAGPKDCWNAANAHPLFFTLIIPKLKNLDLWHLSSHQQLFSGVSMPSLQILKVQIETAEELASLQTLEAPLQQIDVWICDSSLITSGQLIKALESFSNTLTHVYLWTDSWDFGKINKFPTQVNLPNVQHLELSGHFNGSTGQEFPFLNNFPNLKTFLIGLKCPRQPEKEINEHPEIPPMFTYSKLPELHIFYMNSLWIQAPQLEKVTVMAYPDWSTCKKLRFTRSTFELLQTKLAQLLRVC